MKNSCGKENRLKVIADILRTQTICSQEELLNALKEKGCAATQATLSRDLREMGVVKVSVGAQYRYVLHASHPTVSHANPATIVSIDATGNLVVVKTGPGFAAAVASIIDASVLSADIMGTIAGDDTVLVIMRNAEAIDALLAGMEKMIPGCSAKFQSI